MIGPKKAPITPDYAPRTGYAVNVNWNYVVIGSVAMTVVTWLGYAWAASHPGDFSTVTNGLLTSTIGCLVGGLLLLLVLASLIPRVPKPGWLRLGVVALLTASQQIGWYQTDVLFGWF